MRVAGAGILLCATLLLSGCGKKSNADLIVGKWELTKAVEGVPAGMVTEFTKDGKVKATVNLGGKDLTMEGTYKVDGDKLTVTMKMGQMEKSDTDKIKTLNDTTLVIENSKGQTEEFKRK
jgi:uncharacterized protein (TIGR03066 family)